MGENTIKIMNKIKIILALCIFCTLLFSSIKWGLKERAGRLRMTDNYNSANDSIRISVLSAKEFRDLKKEAEDVNLKVIDSLQKALRIKNKQVNSATQVIVRYRDSPKTVIVPKVDTVYIKKDSAQNTAPFAKLKYNYIGKCITFDATVDSKMNMTVDNVTYADNFTLIDYTRRRKTWLFGLRLGRKKRDMETHSNCGAISKVSKYVKSKR